MRPVTLILLIALLASGCTAANRAFDRYAGNNALNKSFIAGKRYSHAVYAPLSGDTGTTILHIYIGGDGTPWKANQPASDPTPRNALALRLMLLDSAPSVYVGRPCYHGANSPQVCAPSVWTSARYSADVVDSMSAAIENILASRSQREVGIIG